MKMNGFGEMINPVLKEYKVWHTQSPDNWEYIDAEDMVEARKIYAFMYNIPLYAVRAYCIEPVH
jgi:hypothetical protein